METERLQVRTGGERRVVDLTRQVQAFVRGRGDGLVNISLPHATAGLALIELGAGSDGDLLDAIDRILPRQASYSHTHGSPGHGADHVLPAFIAPTLTLPVLDGEVELGTWQSIAMVDTNVDNPDRELLLAFIASG